MSPLCNYIQKKIFSPTRNESLQEKAIPSQKGFFQLYSDGIGIGSYSIRLSNFNPLRPLQIFKATTTKVAQGFVSADKRFTGGLLLTFMQALPTVSAQKDAIHLRDNQGGQYKLDLSKMNEHLANNITKWLQNGGCDASIIADPYKDHSSYCKFSTGKQIYTTAFVSVLKGTNTSEAFLSCFKHEINSLCFQYEKELMKGAPFIAFSVALVTTGLIVYMVVGGRGGRAVNPVANPVANPAVNPDHSFNKRFEILQKKIEELEDKKINTETIAKLKKNLQTFEQRYTCPISRCIMNVPYTATSGHTYDLESIQDYLRSKVGLKIDPKNNAFILTETVQTNMQVNFNERRDMQEKIGNIEKEVEQLLSLISNNDSEQKKENNKASPLQSSDAKKRN